MLQVSGTSKAQPIYTRLLGFHFAEIAVFHPRVRFTVKIISQYPRGTATWIAEACIPFLDKH